jgi:cardiolipin synthase
MKNRKILTIPNLLSLLRLIMIPQLMWLYLRKQDYIRTVILLALSGATDVLDGIIARKFDMISDFGKAFDPVADKLTQMAMLYCVGTTFPEIRFLLILLVVKEVLSGIMSLISIKKTGQVQGAQWHGKAVTVLLYTLIADRIVPGLLSHVLLIVCAGMMLLSMALYWKRHWNSIREASTP